MMIRAIIFDCFGVLVTEGWLEFKALHFGHDAELNRQAADLLKQADSGLLDHENFMKEIAEMAGLSVEEVHRALDNNIANLPLFEYIAELKPTYKIGILSNAATNWLRELFTEDQLALVDAVSLSYEAGYVKPDLEAYKSIAQRLGRTEEECVFVDDQLRYCTAARESGMQAILYENFPQLKRDLDKLLADSKG